ncbi:uncharacterized protein K441DRAFT_508876, partial [Cenococcum geophilum 1.58]|uniref:uncharacterized protein n=1 Tax=Cenococcum geophilum 1.58 TaxID=794803 RepID=UPI00358F90DC
LTKDNKTSYVAKEQLSRIKVIGIEQVNTLQDGVNNLAAGQLGRGCLSESIGNLASEEGVNHAERGGKEEYTRPIEKQGPLGVYTVPLAGNVGRGGGSLVEGAKGAGGSLGDWLGGG